MSSALQRSANSMWTTKSRTAVAAVVIRGSSFSSSEVAQKVQKVKKKEKKRPDQGKRGRDKHLELLLAALDAPSSQAPPASPEEMKRRHEIGRNYVIGKFNRHNDLNHDLSCKLKLKRHAINMLPRNNKALVEAALSTDLSGPPKWRRIPTDTPPIPNFDPSMFLEKE